MRGQIAITAMTNTAMRKTAMTKTAVAQDHIETQAIVPRQTQTPLS
jgi:hypothetical protein